MWKKASVLILTVLLVISLAGCSSGGDIGDPATDVVPVQEGGVNIGDGQTPLAADLSGYTSETELMALEILELCNEIRAEKGLEPFAWDDGLYQVCSIRSDELLLSFAHTRPDGTRWTTAMADAGIAWSSAAENVAMGYKSAQAVVNGWMNSEGHRTNILSANTHMAAAAVAMPADSKYKGYAFAQLFYTP